MSFHQVRITPYDYEAPFPPLAEMATAQGRLRHLASLIPIIAEAGDATAINAALDYAIDLNHLANEMSERAADLASRPEARELQSPVLTLTSVITGLSRADAQQISEDHQRPEITEPSRQQLRSARDLLRTATDGAAIETLTSLVRNYPPMQTLCDASVSLAMGIRTDTTLRNQERGHDDPRTDPQAYDGPASHVLQSLARQGYNQARRGELAILRVHDHNLQFSPSPKVSQSPTAMQTAQELHVAPSIFHHAPIELDLVTGSTRFHLLVYQHLGQKRAQGIDEAYPEGFPAQLAIEHMQAVSDSTTRDPINWATAPVAFSAAKAALMGLHTLKPETLSALCEEAGADAPLALLLLCSGDPNTATLLARQAGHPNMEFPASLPGPDNGRCSRVWETLGHHIPAKLENAARARIMD